MSDISEKRSTAEDAGVPGDEDLEEALAPSSSVAASASLPAVPDASQELE